MAEKGLSLRNRLLGRSDLLGRVGSFVPALANALLHNPLSRCLAAVLFGVAEAAPLPRWHHETFLRWLNRTRSQRLRSQRKVVYFTAAPPKIMNRSLEWPLSLCWNISGTR